MEKNYPKADQIQKDFCKKLCGLQTFMNVYSFTLRLGLLTEEEFDLVVESVLCKIAQNRKAIDMITNDDARAALRYEQVLLNDLLVEFTNQTKNKEE